MSLQDPRRMSVIRVWDALYRGARQYVESEGFIGVHNCPEIVGVTGACENVDTLFKVDYFGKQAYLAQSDQLYLEMLTPYLGKVYAEIQSFRAEDVVDDRHLCQFGLFEIEHQGDLEQLRTHLTGILRTGIRTVLRDCLGDLRSIGVSDAHVDLLTRMADATDPILKSVRYAQVVEDLKSQFPGLEWGDDLKADHEAAAAALYGPHFITHYPLDIKFFNMREGTCVDADRDLIVNSCDLILPHSGESAGAAERETEYETVVRRLKTSEMYRLLKSQGVQDEDFDWYLDAHKGKDIPLHSGAGVGMARVAQFILEADDIRDAVPFVINRETLL